MDRASDISIGDGNGVADSDLTHLMIWAVHLDKLRLEGPGSLFTFKTAIRIAFSAKRRLSRLRGETSRLETTDRSYDDVEQCLEISPGPEKYYTCTKKYIAKRRPTT